jgi:hypothetical protein
MTAMLITARFFTLTFQHELFPILPCSTEYIAAETIQ